MNLKIILAGIPLLGLAVCLPTLADDPLPAGLDQAITRAGVPMIVDVTILRFNKEGHGQVSVNKTYKDDHREPQPPMWGTDRITSGSWIRGYALSDKQQQEILKLRQRSAEILDLLERARLTVEKRKKFQLERSDIHDKLADLNTALKIASLRTLVGGKPGRYLLFLDGDLLYSTYNNRFPIREGKGGALEVGIGFNGGGAPWKPLKEIVKRIPAAKAKPQKKGTR